MLVMKIIHSSSSKISAHTNFDLLSTEYYIHVRIGWSVCIQKKVVFRQWYLDLGSGGAGLAVTRLSNLLH
jgi:hypothetical protein